MAPVRAQIQRERHGDYSVRASHRRTRYRPLQGRCIIILMHHTPRKGLFPSRLAKLAGNACAHKRTLGRARMDKVRADSQTRACARSETTRHLLREANIQQLVEATRAEHRRVNHVRAIGSSDNKDAFARVEPVHLSQQLVHDALRVHAALATALGTQGIEFVEEDNTRRRRGSAEKKACAQRAPTRRQICSTIQGP